MGEHGGTVGRRALQLLPLLLVLAVLGAVVGSIVGLLGTAHPDIGYFRSNTHDGLALKAGQGLFNPPGQGYTGLLYTPGLPILLAGLNTITVWEGWAPLVTMLSVLVLAAYAGRLALGEHAAPRSAFAVVAALGVAATAVWLVTPLVGDQLTGAGPDHLCWALALGGLLLVPRAGTGAPRATIAAIALLTAAFWVKQPGALAGAIASAWLGYQALRGRLAWRDVLRFVGALAVVNLALIAIANIVTSGEQWSLNIALGQEHARLYGVRRVVEDAVRGLSPVALTAAALGLVAGWRGRGQASRESLLLAFAVAALPFLMVFRAKQGGEDNQYLGTAWALALLAAAWWGAARADGRAALRADLVLAAVVGVALLGTSAGIGRLTVDGLRVQWVDSTADLRAFAATRSVYHPVYSDITYPRDHRVWQDVPNVADLLAAGKPPGELLPAFLDRRFDAVVPFAAALPTAMSYLNEYASAYGRREDAWFWKLDRVIAERYAPVPAGPGVPAGVLARRPGPERAAWMRRCFGPFDVRGTRWEIRRGGGFWCHASDTDTRVVLRETPAARSELVTSDPVRWSGTVIVAPARTANAFAITAPGRLAILGTRIATGWEVTTNREAPRRLNGRLLRVALPASDGAARLSLWSDRGGAAFDLRDLRLQG